jgi:hypothetical protein
VAKRKAEGMKEEKKEGNKNSQAETPEENELTCS